jgi:outer membrane protein assembly factor BamB
MIPRRTFLTMAAVAGPMFSLPRLANAGMPDLSGVPTKTAGKVEVVYKTPHAKPNGMDVTPEGFWVIDQGTERFVSLINPTTGALIREFQAEGILLPSGVCIDGDTCWIGSTYNRLIVAVDARTGKLINKFSTPGAGQIYKVKGDQAGSRTPLQPAYPPPPPPPPAPPGTRTGGGRQGAGKQDPTVTEGPAGTGAHCVLVKGDLLYVDVPPARMIYVINKNTWEVQDFFQTAGDRPHDMVWANAEKTQLWCSDSNLAAFFLHDAQTGKILQRIQLPPGSPVVHGAKLYNGYMYYCDDVGWMCRFKMP